MIDTQGGSAAVPDLRSYWRLDPAITLFNHGSFGACPEPVLAVQRDFRDQLEADPIDFLGRRVEGLLDTARAGLGAFVGADPDDLAFVPNATTGASTVLRSLRFEPGDEILGNNHEYNAVLNAMRFAAERDGARVVTAELPLPLSGPGEVLESILGAVTPRTKLVVVSHITSCSALILPVAELVRELDQRGIDTLIDGAHAPGNIPLDITAIGAAYYTGNCHKWLCGPKGSAFLHVRRDRQKLIRPLTISHGTNSTRTDRSFFRLEFDWSGTTDPTPFLALPEAIRFLSTLRPGGMAGHMAANHALALSARDLLCRSFGTEPQAPDDMLGSMCLVPVPDGERLAHPEAVEGLADTLFRDFGMEVAFTQGPVMPDTDKPAFPGLHLRVSAQAYLDLGHFEALANAIVEVLGIHA